MKKEMTFVDCRNILNNNHVSPYYFVLAAEVDKMLDQPISDADFNRLCRQAKDIWLEFDSCTYETAAATVIRAFELDVNLDDLTISDIAKFIMSQNLED